MSERLVKKVFKTGLLTGSNVGSKLSMLHSIRISASSILRLIHKAPLIKFQVPEVLGIDDWAYKKRIKYGSVIVDLERHRIIDLLPDQKALIVKKWFIDNPGVKIVSRDRFSNYTRGGNRQLPRCYPDSRSVLSAPESGRFIEELP
ncbi:transposase [Chitinophaga sancti]|nr:transposase [Chitinophaga sancti]WQD59591.1 transposase [Chitinophaga sancti]WQG88276.1 transposase [Chitinophaga sancti]